MEGGLFSFNHDRSGTEERQRVGRSPWQTCRRRMTLPLANVSIAETQPKCFHRLVDLSIHQKIPEDN